MQYNDSVKRKEVCEMIPKSFNSYDANTIISGMTEEDLKILRNCIDSKLEKIKEARRAHFDELGHRLASVIAEIQAKKGEITIAICDEYGEKEDSICICPDYSVAIRVE